MNEDVFMLPRSHLVTPGPASEEVGKLIGSSPEVFVFLVHKILTLTLKSKFLGLVSIQSLEI